MEEKGLCRTCVNDKGCTYSRDFPVWQCEEFSGDNPKSVKLKKTKQKKQN